jgi:hypothetical protein
MSRLTASRVEVQAVGSRGQEEFDVLLYSLTAAGRGQYKAWVLATCPDKRIRDGKKAVELALVDPVPPDVRVTGHSSAA